MRKAILLILVAALAACIRAEDVRLTGVKDYSFELPSKAGLVLGVENRSGKKLQLLECKFDVNYRGSKAMAVTLAEPVAVARRFAGDVPVNFRVMVSNLAAGLAVMNDPDRALREMTLTGHVVVKAGIHRKKIELHDQPVSQIIATFGL